MINHILKVNFHHSIVLLLEAVAFVTICFLLLIFNLFASTFYCQSFSCCDRIHELFKNHTCKHVATFNLVLIDLSSEWYELYIIFLFKWMDGQYEGFSILAWKSYHDSHVDSLIIALRRVIWFHCFVHPNVYSWNKSYKNEIIFIIDFSISKKIYFIHYSEWLNWSLIQILFQLRTYNMKQK